jgi:hypothetical protein
VLKFGGSSLATPDCIRDVGRIVLSAVNGTPAIVVVSAFQGVTNQLLDCARLAERRDPECEQAYDRIAARHRSAIDNLLNRPQGCRARALVDEHLGELRDALHGIRLLGHCPPAALDVAASFGERLSALITVPEPVSARNPSMLAVLTRMRIHTRQRDLPEDESRRVEYFSSFWQRSPRPSRSSPGSSVH